MPRSFLVKTKHRNGSGKVIPEVACEPPKIISIEPSSSSSTRLDTIRVEDFDETGENPGKTSESESECIVVTSTSDDDRGSFTQEMSPYPVEDRIDRGRESGSVKSCGSEEYEEEEEEEKEEVEEEEEEEEKRTKSPNNEYRYRRQDTYERTVPSENLFRSFHVPFRSETNHTQQAAETSRISLLLARSAASSFPLASIPRSDTAILQNSSSDSWHIQEQFHHRDPCLVPKWSSFLSRGVHPHSIALRTAVDSKGGIFLPGRYCAWLETGATATPASTIESRRQPFLSSANSDSSNTPPLVPSDDSSVFPTSLLVPNYGAVTPNRVSSCSSPSPPPLASTPSRLYPHNPERHNVSVRLQEPSLPKLGFSVPEILWGRDGHRKPLAPTADSTSIVDEQTRRLDTNPFECATCRKKYSTFNGLAKHQRAVHCGTTTSSSSKQQTVARRLECPRCDRVYTTVGALKMHIRTHTLPCHCPVCAKAFSRPWLLQGHMRTHTGERPFECPHCARAFADRSNLRAHLQTHSDVKRYCCSGCGKTFSRMSLLMKHGDSICCSM